MRYRTLGRTGLEVSEIGFGGEWVGKLTQTEVDDIVRRCEKGGVNIVDCWMADALSRSRIGDAIQGRRERWIVQGHIGSTWQDGQYVRTRDLAHVKPAFEDLLARFHTDHIDLGMVHFIDKVAEFDEVMAGPFGDYVRELKAAGTVRHVGLSTHNPAVAAHAVRSGEVEMVMFSVNPAFDLLPASEDITTLFGDYDEGLAGIDPVRAELYALAESAGVGITVMKAFAGGRLFSAETSPFGVALSPVQCLHYALTRPAVASVMAGFGAPEHVDAALAYEEATPAELDYASVLAGAPRHAYLGQCTYCGHCAPCPRGIDVAMVNKYLDLAEMQDDAPASVADHYRALDARAADCIGCRACEARCPFGVPVVERMARARELFGA